MKIGLAQIQPERGNIQANINLHVKWIKYAILQHVNLIVFPELSITGYEPEQAKHLATNALDTRFTIFQELSNFNQITIGIGMPIQTTSGILISLVFYRPHQSPTIYSKQHLHRDEHPYFIEGKEQVLLSLHQNNIAPAICYESLQPKHAQHAHTLGSSMYLASVSKPPHGILKAYNHYPNIASQFSMPVCMVNSVGFCDNFMSLGQSAIWDKTGRLIKQLDASTEGLLTHRF